MFPDRRFDKARSWVTKGRLSARQGIDRNAAYRIPGYGISP